MDLREYTRRIEWHVPRDHMTTETELKYKISGASWDTLLHASFLGPFGLHPAQEQQVLDVYADTSHGAFRSAGYAFRIRSQGESRFACLKGLDAGDGLGHRREEYECEIGDAHAPEQWPESEAKSRFLTITAGHPVEAHVEIRQSRIKRMLRSADADVAELSLDEVMVQSGETRHTFFELEIELLPHASIEVLEKVHEVLSTDYAVLPVSTSKYQRALLLTSEETPPFRCD